MKLGIPEERKGLCPECSEEKDGIVFCPAEHSAGDFISIGRGQDKFLCIHHFQMFLEAGGHEVIMGDKKWLKKRK